MTGLGVPGVAAAGEGTETVSGNNGGRSGNRRALSAEAVSPLCRTGTNSTTSWTTPRRRKIHNTTTSWSQPVNNVNLITCSRSCDQKMMAIHFVNILSVLYFCSQSSLGSRRQASSRGNFTGPFSPQIIVMFDALLPWRLFPHLLRCLAFLLSSFLPRCLPCAHCVRATPTELT